MATLLTFEVDRNNQITDWQADKLRDEIEKALVRAGWVRQRIHTTHTRTGTTDMGAKAEWALALSVARSTTGIASGVVRLAILTGPGEVLVV